MLFKENLVRIILKTIRLFAQDFYEVIVDLAEVCSGRMSSLIGSVNLVFPKFERRIGKIGGYYYIPGKTSGVNDFETFTQP